MLRRIWHKLFHRPNEPFTHEWTRFSNKPMAIWKRNLVAAFSGTFIGLYLGQYFPDIYYHQIASHLP